MPLVPLVDGASLTSTTHTLLSDGAPRSRSQLHHCLDVRLFPH